MADTAERFGHLVPQQIAKRKKIRRILAFKACQELFKMYSSCNVVLSVANLNSIDFVLSLLSRMSTETIDYLDLVFVHFK